MEKRYFELDSLRGLAALSVVFSHYFILFPQIEATLSSKYSSFWTEIYTFSPFHIFWAGHEAVILFFVLSGFVLSLPYYKHQDIAYFSFIIKRICRVYIPYLIVLIFCVFIKINFINLDFQGLSLWANAYKSSGLPSVSIIEHLTLVNTIRYQYINPVIWSLVHEMRISLIFPFVMLFVRKWNWKVSLCIAMTLSVVALLNIAGANKIVQYNLEARSYLLSLHYVLFFVIGALLAKYRQKLVDIVDNLQYKTKIILLCSSIFLYAIKWILFGLLRQPILLKFDTPYDYFTAIGVAIIIILSLSSNLMSKILKSKAVNFLGKISYSLYLIHFITLFLFLNFLYGIIPMWLLLSLHLISTLLLSNISYNFIEVPSIKLGRMLIEKIIPQKNILQNIEIKK